MKVFDSTGGQPFDRIRFAAALGIGASGSEMQMKLYSANKYKLTSGTHTGTVISVLELAKRICRPHSPEDQQLAKETAFLNVEGYKFLADLFGGKELPKDEFAVNIVAEKLTLDEKRASACWAAFLDDLGELGWIVENGGRRYLTTSSTASSKIAAPKNNLQAFGTFSQDSVETGNVDDEMPGRTVAGEFQSKAAPKPEIFIAHAEKRQKIALVIKDFLQDQLGIKCHVVEFKPNMGDPLLEKVDKAINACGYAIVILTKDLELKNDEWVPSPSVVFEIGRTYSLYEGRVIVLKETGLTVGALIDRYARYPFTGDEVDSIMMKLFSDLRAFGLIKIGQ